MNPKSVPPQSEKTAMTETATTSSQSTPLWEETPKVQSQQQEPSKRARDLVENLSRINWKHLGAGELHDAEDLVLNYIAALELAAVVDSRSFFPKEVAPAGAPQRGELTRDEAKFLAQLQDDAYELHEYAAIGEQTFAKLRLIAESPEERA